MVMDVCGQDYYRLFDSYDKLYNKVNIALAFVGVILSIILKDLDFSSLASAIDSYAKRLYWPMAVYSVHFLLICLTLIMFFGATIRFLRLLLSRQVKMIKTEDARNIELYREEEQYAAVWVIDKYTIATNHLRGILKEKQKYYDRSLIMIILGLVFYAMTIILQKVGF